MVCMAYDIGASGSKLYAGHFDGSRLTLETLRRESNAPIPLANGLYWDFLRLYTGLRDGLADAQARMTVDSVGIDAFCNDFGLIDKEGALLCPMRCYRDERAVRARPAVLDTMSARELYEATGNQVAVFNTLFQLVAMQRDGHGGLLEMADKLLLLPDLLGYYLTGVALSEYTVSSVTQFFDFNTGDWHHGILECYGIPARILSEVVQPGVAFGRTLDGIKAIKVCSHDTASAFLAAFSDDPAAILSSGTWALLGRETTAPIVTDVGFAHNVANEGGYPGHHRLLCNVMGNWQLQELRREYQAEGTNYSFADWERLAAAETPFRCVVDVNDDVFFAPGAIRRKLCDKTILGVPPETPGEYARCIYDSLALRYRYTLEVLTGLAGELQTIHMVGGGCKDKLMAQLTADVCGLPLLAGPEDATALGNIIVQLIGLGVLRDISEGRELLRFSMRPRVYSPRPLPGCNEVYGAFKDSISTR